jgi:hypothetical protein
MRMPVGRCSSCKSKQNLVFSKSFILNSILRYSCASFMSSSVPIIFKSSTYTEIIQNSVEDLCMKIQGQSSLLEYLLFRRNSFRRLYHILLDYFKPYNDLLSLVQYMLRPTFAFNTYIPLGAFKYISESSDPSKYAVTTSINYKDRRF